MKKIFLLLVGLFLCVLTYAVVSKTVNLTAAGSLSSSLTATEKTTITNLTIIGSIDARDFKTMRDNMTKLSVLDLKNANIVGYTGTLGTESTSSTIYLVNEVPNYAFCVKNATYYKLTLTSVSLPQTSTRIGFDAFAYCKNMTSLIIPPSIQNIDASSFSACISLSSISIPSSVTTIGQAAFLGCTGLSTVTIPTNVSTIGTDVFCNCTNLATVYYNATTISLSGGISGNASSLFKGCSSLSNVSIGENVKEIPKSFLCGCNGITSITIPSTVEKIGLNAFVYCKNLSTIYYNATNYTAPASGIFNFEGNSALLRTVLSNLIIGSNVKIIPPYLFKLSDITSVNIPLSVLDISDFSFLGSKSLTTVSIPSTLSHIGDMVFYDCTALANIYSNPINPIDLSLQTSVFGNVNKSTCILHVPVGSKSLYQASVQWKDFLNIVEDLPANIYVTKNLSVKIHTIQEGISISGLTSQVPICVYTLSGQLVGQKDNCSDAEEFKLPSRGIYIAKIGNESVKVNY